MGLVKIPFTPSVYEHAAQVVGRPPWDVSRDGDLLYEGHKAAFLEYRHVPVAAGIDLYNLEAEAYGARIAKPDGFGIPAITEPLFRNLSETSDLPAFDPKSDGRVPMVLEAARRLKLDLPEADVRIPVAGPFSIAVNLLGIGALCEEVALHPQGVADLLRQLARNQGLFCAAAVAMGLDIAFLIADVVVLGHESIWLQAEAEVIAGSMVVNGIGSRGAELDVELLIDKGSTTPAGYSLEA